MVTNLMSRPAAYLLPVFTVLIIVVLELFFLDLRVYFSTSESELQETIMYFKLDLKTTAESRIEFITRYSGSSC